MAEKNPQNVTVRGRLSWPVFSYAEAVKRDAKSNFPKANKDDVKPSYSLLLDEAQAEKLINHLKNEFLPWCEAQGKAGDKSGLTAAQVKKLVKILDEADWEVDGVFGLIRAVGEKSAELAPEAVLSLSVKGFKGTDIEQKAIVRSEDELRNPADDIVIPDRGLIMPAADTVHDLYPGSVCATTINLFAFVGANVGITATGSTAIFVRDAERFGGGGGGVVDEEEIFMDLDD